MAGRDFEDTVSFTGQLMDYDGHKRADWLNRIWLALAVPALLGISAALISSVIFVLVWKDQWKPIMVGMLQVAAVCTGISIPFAIIFWWREYKGADRGDFVLHGLQLLFEHLQPTDNPSQPVATLVPGVDPNAFVYKRLRASPRQQKVIAQFLAENPRGFSSRKLKFIFGDDQNAALNFLNDCVVEGLAEDYGNKYVLNENGYNYFGYLLASPAPPPVMPLDPQR